jgi:hypothetical protein
LYIYNTRGCPLYITIGRGPTLAKDSNHNGAERDVYVSLQLTIVCFIEKFENNANKNTNTTPEVKGRE